MKRLWLALGAFAVLMLLTWITIDDQRFRLGALAILALFAVRTWSHHRKLEQEAERQGREEEE
jgi:membrane protein implicated in regulation of membrane protease activity